MADLEDGELPNSPEGQENELGGSRPAESNEEDPVYTPLLRPEVAAATRPRSATNSSMVAHAGDLETRDWGQKSGLMANKPAVKNDTSDDEDEADSSGFDSSDSDSGPQKSSTKKKKFRPLSGPSKPDHGHVFAAMARRYQEGRRSGNNVWGSIIQEDSLNSELKSFGVGRTDKDYRSDRGAEAYDYHLAAEQEKRSKKNDLDQDLQKYFDKKEEEVEDRRMEAIKAGKKRSVKERLGRKRDHGHNTGGGFPDDMSVPQPGVAREISDLTPELLEEIRELETSPINKMEAENSTSSGSGDGEVSSARKSHLLLGEELARKLCEPKTELIVGVLSITGIEVALELFKKTRDVEAAGGMMIKNGERRRTPGGVFLHLLREAGADPNESRVKDEDVKMYFALSNKDQFKKKKKKSKNLDFMQELKSFQKKSAKFKSKAEAEAANAEAEMEELKPLPDILTCISKTLEDPPPDAPPNSVEGVERTISSYEDDFLSRDVETEDIELF